MARVRQRKRKKKSEQRVKEKERERERVKRKASKVVCVIKAVSLVKSRVQSAYFSCLRVSSNEIQGISQYKQVK